MARNDTPTSVTRRFSNAGKGHGRAVDVDRVEGRERDGAVLAPRSDGLALRLAVLHELLGEGELAPRRRLAPMPCQWCLCAPQEERYAAHRRRVTRSVQRDAPALSPSSIPARACWLWRLTTDRVAVRSSIARRFGSIETCDSWRPCRVRNATARRRWRR